MMLKEIVPSLLDRLVQRRLFHKANTVFEGSIGVFHLLFPFKIYEDADKAIAPEQYLLGRFVGAMMIAIAIMTYVSKPELGIIIGLSVYHSTACLLNLYLGCGIDGTQSLVRDYFHAGIHGCLAIGFLYSWYNSIAAKKPASLGLKAPWRIEGDSLSLNYVARNWKAAMDALNAYSVLAEEMNHHPDVSIANYREVTIVIRTHCRDASMGAGLTEKDLQLAQRLESVPIRLSDKWVKEHDLAWMTKKD